MTKSRAGTMADVIEAITKGLIKSTSATEAYGGALNALGRLFVVCASGRQEPQLLVEEMDCRRPVGPVSVHSPTGADKAPRLVPSASSSRGCALVDLVEGPYVQISAFLDIDDLVAVDSACRPLRELNRAHGGGWCTLGALNFYGLELDGEGAFYPVRPEAGWRQPLGLDWKGRHELFYTGLQTFRAPFNAKEITEVQQADEIAYSRCKLNTDLLSVNVSVGVYLEVEVLANPDNVSLAVVNFDAGGCSSVTFSPDTGAVIRERKVCEEPRKVQGAYIQPLTTITHGQGFEGCIGLYLHKGQLAFFRRHVTPATEDGGEPVTGPWESTGFITDLAWAEGKQLTPCLAFRDEGAYRVKLAYIHSEPPIVPQRTIMAYDESSWSDLNWDADQDADQEPAEI